MSLGVSAISSYKNDPLLSGSAQVGECRRGGVAAAGNNGKNGAGQKVYGDPFTRNRAISNHGRRGEYLN